MAYTLPPPFYDVNPPSYEESTLIEMEKKLKEIQEHEQKLKEKIKQEEREKERIDHIKKEMEEQKQKWLMEMEREKEQKEMKELYAERVTCVNTEMKDLKQGWLTCPQQSGASPAFMKMIENFFSSQTVLYLLRPRGSEFHSYLNLNGVVTTKGVFLLFHFHFSPLYLFDSPPNKRDLAILDQLFCNTFLNTILNLFGIRGDLGMRVCPPYTNYSDYSNEKYARKFESVIRLIPGSYQNGSWKQLDGFFGMYFNEETLELSDSPPPMK